MRSDRGPKTAVCCSSNQCLQSSGGEGRSVAWTRSRDEARRDAEMEKEKTGEDGRGEARRGERTTGEEG